MHADIFHGTSYTCKVINMVFFVSLQVHQVNFKNMQQISTLLCIEVKCHYRSVYFTSVGHHSEKQVEMSALR